MEQLTDYAEIVKRIIREYGQYDSSIGEVETQMVFDDERGHYELIYVGWNDWRRVHGIVLHLDVRDGKIWIQHDGTEEGVANDLVAAGVPREDIVLAFQPPSRRKYTEFAVA